MKVFAAVIALASFASASAHIQLAEPQILAPRNVTPPVPTPFPGAAPPSIGASVPFVALSGALAAGLALLA